MPQALKIPDAKAAVEKEWENSKINSIASLIDICHLKNAELEPKFQKY